MTPRCPDRRLRPPARIFTALAALITGALGLGSPAQAQSLSPAAAPPAWVRYAEAATQAVSAWLEGDDAAAARVRAHLDATRPADDRPTPPLVLKLWIAPDGDVSQVIFAALSDEQAGADLRALIVGRRLPPPPKGILLPIRLAVALEPAPGASRPAPSDGFADQGRHTSGF